MNHVHVIALRSVGSCLRTSPWSKPVSILSRQLRPLLPNSQLSTSVCGLSRSPFIPPSSRCLHNREPTRQLSTTSTARLQHTLTRYALGPLKAQGEVEKGLAFGEEPLTSSELHLVFGDVVPPEEIANRLLKVLHGRRVDGTLDLPLPEDLQEVLEQYPHTADAGLEWLRDNYEVDEDDAIVARIEREESGYQERTPSQLMQRAQDLRLLSPQSGRFDETRKERREAEAEAPEYYGPQSGRYQAKLSEKGDVFGESQIEKIRAQNEAEAKREEEELEQQIEEIQAKRIAKVEAERSQALAARPEQGIEAAEEEIRPPNEFEKWVLRAKNKAASKLTLDSPEIKNKSLAARLLPSFAFVAVFCTGCWFLSQYWATPKRSDRLLPNMSLSFATVTGIIATNVAIFVLWRFPPAWAILNRYFLVVPAKPNPLSLFGNIFSHVQAKHLLFNMLPLLIFGPSLHEDMGRGAFLALYLASGVVGSFASLTHHAARGILHTSSLGASGSVWAVTAAFFNIHGDNDFTLFFMPEEWKDKASAKGWVLFSLLIAADIIGGLRGKPVTVDYVAHASGALTGWSLTEWYKRSKSQSREHGEFESKSKIPWWQLLLQKGGNQDKGGS